MLVWRECLRFVKRCLITFPIILKSLFLTDLGWMGFFPYISKEGYVSLTTHFLFLRLIRLLLYVMRIRVQVLMGSISHFLGGYGLFLGI